MRHHKFYLVLVSVLVLSLGLVACSQPAEPKTADDSKVNNAETEAAPAGDQVSPESTEADTSAVESAESATKKLESKAANTADQDEVTDIESLVEERDTLDGTATYQVVVAKEDGNYSFKELAIPDFSAWMAAQTQPVFLDFWAPWCQPCVMASPEVDKLASSYGEDLKVLKVNVEGLPAEIVAEYKISGIPRFILLEDQEVKDEWEGFSQDRMDEIRQSIDQLIG